ncbi:hypothetical protein [Trichloromonas sp.]|jgi:hypothetical protein|uniref:hypothetical protein n=1 Tax=Trichloromonas sp. TaxID=3069249 RepID=UPI002A3D8611|nr:hypothetical protein [Trichloromonas sp.]
MKKDLIDKINKASNLINQKQRYGRGNYMIVSPIIAEQIKNINLLEERKNKIKQIFKRIKNNI